VTSSRDKRLGLVLAVGLLLFSGSDLRGPFPVSAADTPSTPLPSSNPLSGDQDAIQQGRKLYFTWCVQCHGPKADGVSRFGHYAADLRQFWRGYREFVAIVKDGRVERQMPPWKEILGDRDIAQIGAYLETLAIEGANWKDMR